MAIIDGMAYLTKSEERRSVPSDRGVTACCFMRLQRYAIQNLEFKIQNYFFASPTHPTKKRPPEREAFFIQGVVDYMPPIMLLV
jgi:hypothetical protein